MKEIIEKLESLKRDIHISGKTTFYHNNGLMFISDFIEQLESSLASLEAGEEETGLLQIITEGNKTTIYHNGKLVDHRNYYHIPLTQEQYSELIKIQEDFLKSLGAEQPKGESKACQSFEKYKELSEDILDLQQYVTNLLYNAYADGKQNLKSTVFDEWVEEQVNLIQEYAKTYTSQQMPSEEEIEEHFSIEAHRVGFIPSEGYNRMQRHKIEGAKWVINQINKKQ